MCSKWVGVWMGGGDPVWLRRGGRGGLISNYTPNSRLIQYKNNCGFIRSNFEFVCVACILGRCFMITVVGV